MDVPALTRSLGLLWMAFKGWMFVDAVQRRADQRWYWIILLMPGGAFYYAYAVKLRDPGVGMAKQRLLDHLSRPPSLEELQRRFDETPSIENRVRLAQGLYDAGRYTEAHQHFEAVLEGRDDDKDALFGFGLCCLELGEPERAVGALERLVKRQPSYREFAAYRELARALWDAGEEEACLEALVGLERLAPRLPHQVLRAQYLRRAGQPVEARDLLRRAIAEEKAQPRHVRRLNRGWMRRAKRMLGELRGS